MGAEGRRRTVALLGGSFNPPHVGHLLIAQYVHATVDVDAVWLMPSANHPLGKPLTPYAERRAMCAALTGETSGWLEVTDVEAELGGGGRTVDTLEHLTRAYSDTDFVLVVGSDIVAELPLWKDVARIRELSRMLIFHRAGYPEPEAVGPPIVEVSSTDIREDLRAGRDVSDRVPRAVLRIIFESGLYREPG